MREPLLGVVVGKKGVGKTHETIQLVQKIVMGNPLKLVKPAKVLLFDANDEFSWAKAIDVNDVPRFSAHPKIEIRRIRIWKKDGNVSRKMSLDEMADTLSFILPNFYGGTLLIEDPTKYISDSLPADLIGHLCTQRHQQTDVILHFQGWGKLGHPKIFSNCNWVRAHKCEDSVARHENKFAGDTVNLKLAECLINKKYYSGDIRFFCYISKDDGKVRGAFTAEEFKETIDDYLSENYGIIKQQISRINLVSGEKMYASPKQAIDTIRAKYFSEYYGNPI